MASAAGLDQAAMDSLNGVFRPCSLADPEDIDSRRLAADWDL